MRHRMHADVGAHIPNPKGSASRCGYESVNYDRLSGSQRLRGLTRDFRGCVQDSGGRTIGGRAVVSVGGTAYVWRYAALADCSEPLGVWRQVSRVWEYEHAAVLLVFGAVSKAAVAAFSEVQFRESWGWCTFFNDLGCQEPKPSVPLPSNTTEFSLPVFTLDKLRNTAAAQRSFYGLLEFLDVEHDILGRIRVARDAIDQNLGRWLSEGWLLPARAWPLFEPPPRKEQLGDDEVFDEGAHMVMRVDKSLRLAELAKGVLELSSAGVA